MTGKLKGQAEILKKLGITQLNPMQEEALQVISASDEVVLLSPTGTGKTLAFLLPLIKILDPDLEEIQALILVPSRELAIQIEQVLREMGAGFKFNSAYGGRAFAKDKANLKHPPAILVGTPGRVADHLRRHTFATRSITTLVLDEFDKSLEVGFEEQMNEIVDALPQVRKKVLTSATNEILIPEFMEMNAQVTLDFLDKGSSQLLLKTVASPSKDKLDMLVKTLCFIGNEPGIVFCNFRDSIERVSDYLTQNGIAHGCFHGGMEQIDRERSLIKFRNGSHQLIVATDLAARGLDIPEITFILHYHLPIKAHEFVHRNGRTARMNKDGTAYVLHWEKEELPDFIEDAEPVFVYDAPVPVPSLWTTLFISGGRQHKISKGDIAGYFFKVGEIEKNELGLIEIKEDCAFVAVLQAKADELVQKLDQGRLKKKKVRVREV